MDSVNPHPGVMLYIVRMTTFDHFDFTAADRAEPETFTTTSLMSGKGTLCPAGEQEHGALQNGQFTLARPRERSMELTMASGDNQ